ncbi:MAG: IS21 family transposase [Roseburia sp.]|nr:IS21 family transposase [Roseburia sp.]
MKTNDMKPNYSELARIYNMDRRTVKKHYLGLNVDKSPKKYTSKLDKYQELIKTKLLIPGSNRKAVYMYLKTNIDEKIGSYSNFRKYVLKHADKLIPKNNEVHLRFETEMGMQLQFDWKGPMSLYNKDDEVFEFYIFSSTLCASRLHVFTYSKFMTLESVERCLIETFEYINGVPKECLTDNMSSIINYSQHEFIPEFKVFAKDMGFIPKKCKVASPETKGKDESCNRFMNWLYPYNHEFETESELIEIIGKINEQINLEVNSTTNMPPIVLYEKEKEYLNPLPTKHIIDSYLDTMVPAKVSNGLLVYYKGQEYSVPKKYINQTVKLNEVNNKLLIYYNKELIASHDITNKKINYTKEHYIEGLVTTMKEKTESEIEKLAQKNLELLDKLTINRKKENV